MQVPVPGTATYDAHGSLVAIRGQRVGDGGGGQKFEYLYTLDGVPRDVLSLAERAVLIEYWRAADSDLGNSWIGPARVARNLCMDHGNVKKLRRELERKGFLTCVKRGGIVNGERRANEYRLEPGPFGGVEHPGVHQETQGESPQSGGAEYPGTRGSECPTTSPYTSLTSPSGFGNKDEVGDVESVDTSTGEVLDLDDTLRFDALSEELDDAGEDLAALAVVGFRLAAANHPRIDEARQRYTRVKSQQSAPSGEAEGFNPLREVFGN